MHFRESNRRHWISPFIEISNELENNNQEGQKLIILNVKRHPVRPAGGVCVSVFHLHVPVKSLSHSQLIITGAFQFT